ncbi:PKD domain-containing protein [Flavitalea flava]
MKNLYVVLCAFLSLTAHSQTAGLTVKKVILCEYRTFYIASDGKIYSFNAGSPKVVQIPINGRTAIDGAGGFNKFRVLDDQGYIWNSAQDLTTNTNRFDTDASGAPFDKNISVDAYANTSATIRTDGSVWYFGDDTFHFFHTTGKVDMKPTQLSPKGMVFKKIKFGGNRLVGLTSAGQVYEWTFGKGTTPVQKTIPAPAIDIFASHVDYAGCIIPATAGGTTGYPYVWGYYFGAWGGNTGYSQPTSVKTLWGVQSPIKTIDVNWNTTHYIDDQNRMWGLGFNVQGEVGIGSELVSQYNYSSFPSYSWSFTDGEGFSGVPAKQISAGTQWSQLFSNNWFSFYKYALDVNGNLYSWGRNKALDLGNGFLNMQEQYSPNAMDVLVPTKVTPLTTAFQRYNFTAPSISAGGAQTITGSIGTLTGLAKAPQLTKTTSIAANLIDLVGFNIVSYKWTKVSGPASGTITLPNSAITTVTGLATGTYVFNLLTTDNNKGTQSANVTIKVNGGSSGTTPPVSVAGTAQTITLPTSSVTLAGSGTDADGTIASYAWTKTAGPTSFAISNAAIKNPVISSLVAGTYTFRLTVTDNSGLTANSDINITVNAAANKAPVATAGAAQTITLPASSVTLAGSGTDADGTIAAYAWTKTAGPTSFTISNTAIKNPVISNLVAGTYTFRLTVTDNGGLTAYSDVAITVNSAPAGNKPPVASAGTAQSITLPTNSVTLAGSGTDADGTIAAYLWTKPGGPATFTISSTTIKNPVLTNLVAGTYTFRLTVTDNGGLTASSDVVITVNPAKTANQQPMAYGSVAPSITLPVNSIILTGKGTDADGTVVGYAWTKYSGPSAGTITNPNSQNPSITGMVAGTYIFKYVVTDNDGATAQAFITITVNPAVATAPVANAGPDQIITLPTNRVTLNGSGTSASGTITSYLWTKPGGPSTFTISSTTIKNPILTNLGVGTYVFRLTVTDNTGLTNSSDVNIVVGPVTSSNPPPGTKAIPGKIEAENWNAMSGVDTQSTNDVGGGAVVGWIENGDWMDYNVNVAAAGTYTVSLRLSVPYTGTSLQLRLANGAVLASLNLPAYGSSFKDWQTVNTTVVLPAGLQTIRLISTSNSGWNINWLSFASGTTSSKDAQATASGQGASILTPQTDASSAASFTIYPNPVHDNLNMDFNNVYSGKMLVQIVNQAGNIVNTFNIVKDQNYLHTSLPVGNLSAGMYFIRVQIGNWTEVRKMLKL